MKRVACSAQNAAALKIMPVGHLDSIPDADSGPCVVRVAFVDVSLVAGQSVANDRFAVLQNVRDRNHSERGYRRTRSSSKSQRRHRQWQLKSNFHIRTLLGFARKGHSIDTGWSSKQRCWVGVT